MSKSRLEAFSDGVFAIVITLLILDLKVPKVPYAQLLPAILKTAPNFFSYVISYLIVGLFWVIHHNMLSYLSKIDRAALWLNLIFLLCVGFIPYPTALMGEYPNTQIPVVIYGLTLIISNCVGLVLWLYASSGYRLMRKEVPFALIKSITRNFVVAILIFCVGLACSYVSASLTNTVYSLAAVYAVLLRPRYKKHLQKQMVE